MDTSFSFPTAPVISAQSSVPVVPRAQITRVQAIPQSDSGATVPTNKPFIAQVVNARLSGAEFPEIPSEITPPERTLRPYDVPMLPFDAQEAAGQMALADASANRTTTDHVQPASQD